MNKKDLVAIRDATATDVNFVFATWLRGLYYGNDWFREIPSNIFYDTYHKVVQSILSRPSTRVRIACLKEDPDVILSYAVIESKTNGHKLHWAHTKEAWRKLGLARDLIPMDVTEVTHLTQVGRSIKRQKQWIFNPFQ